MRKYRIIEFNIENGYRFMPQKQISIFGIKYWADISSFKKWSFQQAKEWIDAYEDINYPPKVKGFKVISEIDK